MSTAKIFFILVAAILSLTQTGCLFSRPQTDPLRHLEPDYSKAPKPDRGITSAMTVILNPVNSQDHVDLPLLNKSKNEIRRDPVWRWASLPHTYVEKALRTTASDVGITFQSRGSHPRIQTELTQFHRENDTVSASLFLSVTAANGTIQHTQITQTVSLNGNNHESLAEAFGKVIIQLTHETWATVRKTLQSEQ